MSAKIRLNCKNCGVFFYRYKIRVRGGFCGRPCWDRYQRRLGRVLVSCANCRTRVERFKNRLKTRARFFCSTVCRGDWNSQFRSGENSYRWQGGKTAEAFLLRHSLRYKRMRINVFRRDDFTCQLCGVRGGKLHVDHIKPFAQYPDLRFEASNCRTLCIPCHQGTDTWGFRSAA